MFVVRKWLLRGEKSFCVLEYQTSKPVVTVQRAFRAKYAKEPPTDKTIRAWYKYRVFHNECPSFKTLYFCNHEPQMNETCTT